MVNMNTPSSHANQSAMVYALRSAAFFNCFAPQHDEVTQSSPDSIAYSNFLRITWTTDFNLTQTKRRACQTYGDEATCVFFDLLLPLVCRSRRK